MRLRPSPRRRIHATSITLACLAAACVAGGVVAAPPADIGRYTSMSQQPTALEQDRIVEYAEYWAERLGSDDPAEVGEAYRKLERPLTAPLVTVVFRSVYSDALIPKLTAIVEDRGENGTRAFQPVNALKVTFQIGTLDALDLLIEHCNQDLEPRSSVRMWAAHGFRHLVLQRARDTGPEVIRPARIVGAIRRMGEAAAVEDDPWVLVAQFNAIGATNETNTIAVMFDTIDSV